MCPLPKNATEAAIDLEFAQQQRKDVYYTEQAENASVKLFIQHCKVARTVLCETDKHKLSAESLV